MVRSNVNFKVVWVYRKEREREPRIASEPKKYEESAPPVSIVTSSHTIAC